MKNDIKAAYNLYTSARNEAARLYKRAHTAAFKAACTQDIRIARSAEKAMKTWRLKQRRAVALYDAYVALAHDINFSNRFR
jgi:hypothetical protein